MKKNVILRLYLILIGILLIGCSTSKNTNSTIVETVTDVDPEHKEKENETDIEGNKDEVEVGDESKLISSEGNTLATRINPPKNYERVQTNENSFTKYMRDFVLKEDGSPVLLYNGEEKNIQSYHVAVFDLEVGDKDLQQCADSIIRLYAQYYWSIGEYDKIEFHLTNNFLMKYVKWREGYRLSVNGNDTSWIKSAEYDDSYDNFLSYLEIVFVYAGTLSLDAEGIDINIAEIAPGDMFIKGASPGHCVLVIDMVENSEGEKAFLLAQGYMPAQEFHVLINPLHEEDPWYYASEITYPFKTPQWTFDEGSLERWFK